MAYIGINNRARKIKNVYIGVNDIARSVKRGYVGNENTIPCLWWGDRYPMMKASDTWYSGISVDIKTITAIEIYDYYRPDTYTQVWNADVNSAGHIKCYRIDTKLIISGCGDGKIYANPDSSLMFESFQAVESITGLEYLDTSKVTNMWLMFGTLFKLKSLDLSSFDTSNVTNMSWMFSNCETLTSLDLSSFNTSNVELMDHMFENGGKLRTVNVSSFNTSKVTAMNSMFGTCQALISLDLTSFNTSNVTTMANMFFYCSRLTTIKVSSGWDTSNATRTGMFSYCGTKAVTYV